MEDNTNNNYVSQHSDQTGNHTDRSFEYNHVPPSLLPTVLHRLGLAPEQVQEEMPVEAVIAKLKSNNWEERVTAVRLLGKLETVAPIELLESALDDEDSSVRAAAVHAMGNVGKRAPLHRLAQALHDSDWHVRETAVFALGKQGESVPNEVLKTALHDTDNSVKEAARLALQWHSDLRSKRLYSDDTLCKTTSEKIASVNAGWYQTKTSARYGQLQEKKIMQQDSDSIQTNSKEGRSPYETLPYEALHANHAERFHVLREQTQAHAPQEQLPYEYGPAMPYGEKVTSFSLRRRSSRRWWFIVPIVALLFFVIGAMVGTSVVRSTVAFSTKVSQVEQAQPQPAPRGDILFLFKNPRYSNMLENEISKGLGLSPKEVIAQLNQGKSMTDIASAQGVSAIQLQKIEVNAFNDTLQAAVKAGDISQPDADTWLAQSQNDPQALEKLTDVLFMLNSK